MRARSSDLFILAKAALRAAIRDHDNRLALINDSTGAPARPEPVEAVARSLAMR